MSAKVNKQLISLRSDEIAALTRLWNSLPRPPVMATAVSTLGTFTDGQNTTSANSVHKFADTLLRAVTNLSLERLLEAYQEELIKSATIACEEEETFIKNQEYLRKPPEIKKIRFKKPGADYMSPYAKSLLLAGVASQPVPDEVSLRPRKPSFCLDPALSTNFRGPRPFSYFYKNERLALTREVRAITSILLDMHSSHVYDGKYLAHPFFVHLSLLFDNLGLLQILMSEFDSLEMVPGMSPDSSPGFPDHEDSARRTRKSFSEASHQRDGETDNHSLVTKALVDELISYFFPHSLLALGKESGDWRQGRRSWLLTQTAVPLSALFSVLTVLKTAKLTEIEDVVRSATSNKTFGIDSSIDMELERDEDRMATLQRQYITLQQCEQVIQEVQRNTATPKLESLATLGGLVSEEVILSMLCSAEEKIEERLSTTKLHMQVLYRRIQRNKMDNSDGNRFRSPSVASLAAQSVSSAELLDGVDWTCLDNTNDDGMTLVVEHLESIMKEELQTIFIKAFNLQTENGVISTRKPESDHMSKRCFGYENIKFVKDNSALQGESGGYNTELNQLLLEPGIDDDYVDVATLVQHWSKEEKLENGNFSLRDHRFGWGHPFSDVDPIKYIETFIRLQEESAASNALYHHDLSHPSKIEYQHSFSTSRTSSFAGDSLFEGLQDDSSETVSPRKLRKAIRKACAAPSPHQKPSESQLENRKRHQPIPHSLYNPVKDPGTLEHHKMIVKGYQRLQEHLAAKKWKIEEVKKMADHQDDKRNKLFGVDTNPDSSSSSSSSVHFEATNNDRPKFDSKSAMKAFYLSLEKACAKSHSIDALRTNFGHEFDSVNAQGIKNKYYAKDVNKGFQTTARYQIHSKEWHTKRRENISRMLEFQSRVFDHSPRSTTDDTESVETTDSIKAIVHSKHANNSEKQYLKAALKHIKRVIWRRNRDRKAGASDFFPKAGLFEASSVLHHLQNEASTVSFSHVPSLPESNAIERQEPPLNTRLANVQKTSKIKKRSSKIKKAPYQVCLDDFDTEQIYIDSKKSVEFDSESVIDESSSDSDEGTVESMCGWFSGNNSSAKTGIDVMPAVVDREAEETTSKDKYVSYWFPSHKQLPTSSESKGGETTIPRPVKNAVSFGQHPNLLPEDIMECSSFSVSKKFDLSKQFESSRLSELPADELAELGSLLIADGTTKAKQMITAPDAVTIMLEPFLAKEQKRHAATIRDKQKPSQIESHTESWKNRISKHVVTKGEEKLDKKQSSSESANLAFTCKTSFRDTLSSLSAGQGLQFATQSGGAHFPQRPLGEITFRNSAQLLIPTKPHSKQYVRKRLLQVKSNVPATIIQDVETAIHTTKHDGLLRKHLDYLESTACMSRAVTDDGMHSHCVTQAETFDTESDFSDEDRKVFTTEGINRIAPSMMKHTPAVKLDLGNKSYRQNTYSDQQDPFNPYTVVGQIDILTEPTHLSLQSRKSAKYVWK